LAWESFQSLVLVHNQLVCSFMDKYQNKKGLTS
jgi:hypothetical protein